MNAENLIELKNRRAILLNMLEWSMPPTRTKKDVIRELKAVEREIRLIENGVDTW